jgi:hypothetical protein
MQIKQMIPSPLRPTVQRAYRFARAEYDRQVHERPSASYRSKIAARSGLENFLEHADRLCTDGAVVVPNFFDPEHLDAMRAEFQRLADTNPDNPRADEKKSVHIATSRLRESELFSKMALEPDILALVQYYWGKPVVLNGTGGTRYEPAELPDSGSNQWHHDGKRKQVRVFLFLTDVPPDGQCTLFVPGSHKIFHYDVSHSRLREEDVMRAETIGRCYGPAGSVAIIDTNLAHRANRNPGPRRDTWNYAFRAPNPVSTELNAVPELHPDVVARLTPEERQIVRLG